MPVERQAERLIGPLRPRDRQFLVAFGLVALAAIAAGVVIAATRGGPGGRCFTATYPGPVGGNVVHHCGSAAVQFCRFDAGIAQVAEACRKAGFTVGSSPG